MITLKHKITSFFFCLFFLSCYANASGPQILLVPTCLLSNQFQYQVLGKSDDLWLIKSTQVEKFQQVRAKHQPHCRGFLNVTAAYQHFVNKNDGTANDFLQQYAEDARPSDFTRAYKIQYQSNVKGLIQQIDTSNITANLAKLTAYPDRNADSVDGYNAALWIKAQLATMIKETKREDVALYLIPTTNHLKQPSILLRIGQNTDEAGIVIGSHLDTVAKLNRRKMNNENDASGSVTVLETARLLLKSGIVFKKPIYLIWYAGCEEGKLGSQSVVRYFNENRWLADAVLQLDETGFIGQRERGIGLTDDFTDAGLSAYVADLVNSYVKLPIGAVRCGYACSDHAIWYHNGNRVAYPQTTMEDEVDHNPYPLFGKRTTLSLTHIADFVKLALAFAVELAEPLG